MLAMPFLCTCLPSGAFTCCAAAFLNTCRPSEALAYCHAIFYTPNARLGLPETLKLHAPKRQRRDRCIEHGHPTHLSPSGATGKSFLGCVIQIKNIFRIIGNIKALQKRKIFLSKSMTCMMLLLIFDITDNIIQL